ncbi:MAG: insulinase family protein [Clostridia bacterium]|nr:insulinase family protein [Clostridia bacterium]
MPKIIKLNGGGVLLYEHNNQSKATAYRVGVFRGGYLDKNTGISHLFEHMMFKGTKNYTNDQLSEQIRENFSNLNASTGGEYMLIRSYESNKKLKPALKISSEMMLESVFPEEELKKEKDVVRQEIVRANDDINRVASLTLNKMIYNYPEIKSDTLGDEKKMMAITRNELLDYQKNNLVKENFFASVSSNLPAFVIKKYIKDYFYNKLPSGEKNTFESADLTINGDSKLVVETRDRQKVVLMVAIPCCGFNDLQQSFYLSRLMNHLSGLKGPLFNHFREKKQLVYSVSLRRWSGRQDGVLVFSIETSPDKVNECFHAIHDFIEEVKKGLTQKEIDRLKERYIESDDRYVGHPVDHCANLVYDYMDRKKYIKPRVWDKLNKKLTVSDINTVINQTFGNIEKVFVSIVGLIDKKDVYPINKIIKTIKGE